MLFIHLFSLFITKLEQLKNSGWKWIYILSGSQRNISTVYHWAENLWSSPRAAAATTEATTEVQSSKFTNFNEVATTEKQQQSLQYFAKYE